MPRQCLKCKAIGEWGKAGKCPPCRRMAQALKDATPRRRAQKAKYDNRHERLRHSWEPVVNAGYANCWRCHEPIQPGSAWHLGHRKGRDSRPEHVSCNLRNSNEGKSDGR